MRHLGTELRRLMMGATGFEKPQDYSTKTPILHNTGAQTGAPVSILAITEENPDLLDLIQLWPTLPEHIRQDILRLAGSPAEKGKPAKRQPRG